MCTQSWQVRCLLRARSVEDFRLIPDRLAGFCRLFGERLLRSRAGQFVALFLAGSATLADYFVRRFPRSVASLGGKECLTLPGRAGRQGGESRAGVARTCD